MMRHMFQSEVSVDEAGMFLSMGSIVSAVRKLLQSAISVLVVHMLWMIN